MGLTLEQFFRITPAFGFVWGQTDCLTWPASWAVQCGHPDPAAPFRGLYRSRRAAMRFVRESGGLVAVAAAGAARAGLEAIDPQDAVSGDIGVGRFGLVTDAGFDHPVGMIRAGAFWALLAARGHVLIAEADPLAAWRV